MSTRMGFGSRSGSGASVEESPILHGVALFSLDDITSNGPPSLEEYERMIDTKGNVVHDGNDLSLIAKWVNTTGISFWKKTMYIEGCTAAMRCTVANHVKNDGRSDTYEFKFQGTSYHATVCSNSNWDSNSNPNSVIHAIICTSISYPKRARLNLGKEIFDFIKPRDLQNLGLDCLDGLCAQYEDLQSADKISAMKANLDETHDIMRENIEKILANNEQIDVLVERSADLSESSKTFYRQTRKLNACCVLI